MAVGAADQKDEIARARIDLPAKQGDKFHRIERAAALIEDNPVGTGRDSVGEGFRFRIDAPRLVSLRRNLWNSVR